MASRILMLLLPALQELSAVYLQTLINEAKSGTLPAALKPYATDVEQIASFLLGLIQTPAPTPAPTPTPSK